ncbi:hypothetical protein [Paenibacillus protaetiae]|uniref:Uncharacterized protein n=1 Tax=Paenibacillus protaetiae TaxID=2509456 RepID=A0A4P6EY86_9BACL|nr:hypothetical protein [Paenibacillus protaetiae]QAY68052.1 hypothetical protein ET464_18450 [Paenibacillus protaetiae]
MKAWQGAWHIAKHEIRRKPLGSLFTLFFSGYMALTTYQQFDSSTGHETGGIISMMDFLMLTVFPVLAFSYNRMTFRCWREDTNTRRLAQWRTIPIPVASIVLGRMLQMVFHLLPAMILYFTIQYVTHPELRTSTHLGHYFLFGLFWFFYALGMAVVYLYLELGYSGKQYLLFTILIFFIIGIVTTVIAIGPHIHLVRKVLEAEADGQWGYTAVSLLFSAVMLFSGYKIIPVRLRNRSYLK